MATNIKTRPLFFIPFGILSLLVALGSAPLSPARAAQITNDIGITMSESQNTLMRGGRVTFTVRMTNHGPDGASFVDVGFHLPSQLKMISMTCDLGITPDTPFCEYSSLPVGATVVSRLVATTNPSATVHARLLKVSSSVLFENPGILDPNLGNNSASVRIRLTGRITAP